MDLTSIRQQINNVDEHLEELLIQRLALIKDVANIKKRKNLPIFDPKREEMILKTLKTRVNQKFEPYIEKMFRSMFEISKSYQKELIEEKDN